jgi:hypothetical protein
MFVSLKELRREYFLGVNGIIINEVLFSSLLFSSLLFSSLLFSIILIPLPEGSKSLKVLLGMGKRKNEVSRKKPSRKVK